MPCRHFTRGIWVGDETQTALELMGSLQNVTLTRLARSRRVIFVEGEDFRLIAKFASVAGLAELAAGINIVPVSMEGFSGWARIRNITWGINRTLGTSLLIATVLDRDYFPSEQIAEVRASPVRVNRIETLPSGIY